MRNKIKFCERNGGRKEQKKRGGRHNKISKFNDNNYSQKFKIIHKIIK